MPPIQPASPPFDWALLPSFLAVIEHGSLLRASRALKQSQPTLGRHIEALETQLGVSLFERTGRGLLPTAEARVIAEHARGMQASADALTRAVGRHGAESALAADLHARLDDSANVPQAWRSRLHDLTDRAVGFAREVASRSDNEADARRATSLLYHVASAVALAWEGGRIHEMR